MGVPATATPAQLISTIKAHIEKGDKLATKANDHYIAAGQYLKTLKAEHAGTWVEWEALLKDKIGIGKTRASELMQIADGRKTVEDVRASGAGREAARRERKKISPSRDGETSPLNEADDYVAPPEVIRKNILDIVERHKAVARTCKKWAKVASFDQATKAEVGTAVGELITRWQSVQKVLAQEVTPADKVVVRSEKLRAAEIKIAGLESEVEELKAELAVFKSPARLQFVKDGGISKSQPSIAAPSHEPAPAEEIAPCGVCEGTGLRRLAAYSFCKTERDKDGNLKTCRGKKTDETSFPCPECRPAEYAVASGVALRNQGRYVEAIMAADKVWDNWSMGDTLIAWE